MSTTHNTPPNTEWSYWFDTADMTGHRTPVTLSPSEAECTALASRLGILSLDSLTAQAVIEKRPSDLAYHVIGRFSAQITQACVVTLEPLTSDISDTFEGWFADPEGAISLAKIRHQKDSQKNHGETPILEEKDDPEPLINGKIDLGELVTQFLSLAIDPYPQAEGASFAPPEAPQDAIDPIKNPFAALRDWKAHLTGGTDKE